jgi:hypothetical protein
MKSNFDLFKYFFPGKRWDKYINNICNILDKESLLITGLPYIGMTTTLRYIKEIYNNKTQKSNNIVIYLELFPDNIDINTISKMICNKLQFSLDYPKYLQNLNCE